MEPRLSTSKQMVAVRYIVKDIESSVAFYTRLLGFEVKMQVKGAFAHLTLGDLQLFINQPGAGGAGQSMPDGAMPTPGGWNRFQLQVNNLEHVYDKLKSAGATFRNKIVTGVGGKQVLLIDPSGNLVELFEPAHQQ
jgi:catechol 2,3-dioxygenase-like lactoylglutathione lyase family enzyme